MLTMIKGKGSSTVRTRRVPLFNFRLEPEDKKILEAAQKTLPRSKENWRDVDVALGAFVREAALYVARTMLGKPHPKASVYSYRTPVHERIDMALLLHGWGKLKRDVPAAADVEKPSAADRTFPLPFDDNDELLAKSAKTLERFRKKVGLEPVDRPKPKARSRTSAARAAVRSSKASARRSSTTKPERTLRAIDRGALRRAKPKKKPSSSTKRATRSSSGKTARRPTSTKARRAAAKRKGRG
jgi:hypothetical protein